MPVSQHPKTMLIDTLLKMSNDITKCSLVSLFDFYYLFSYHYIHIITSAGMRYISITIQECKGFQKVKKGCYDVTPLFQMVLKIILYDILYPSPVNCNDS